MRPGLVIMILWGAWILSWLAAMLWSARTEKRADFRTELSYRVVLVLGAVLFFVPAHGYYGPLRFWYIGWYGAWICTALIALGFAFTWWARIHLGTLWSGTITKKTNHRVIDTGPYGIVRHPIYTGLLLTMLATAAAKGTLLGIVGALLLSVGLWMKARLEERWLSQELGAAAYQTYRRKVPMLVPFGPKTKS
ncbi:MAG: isoprenylcysteine carboxylmethyltransferase family protein [Gammaproteobacteria bacterium]